MCDELFKLDFTLWLHTLSCDSHDSSLRDAKYFFWQFVHWGSLTQRSVLLSRVFFTMNRCAAQGLTLEHVLNTMGGGR